MKQPNINGEWMWPGTRTNEERAVDFSSQSARLAMKQYQGTRAALIAACRHPDAPNEGIKIVRDWLNNASKSQPQHSPFRCWINPTDWKWISLALKGWDTYAKLTPEYTWFNTARKRGWHHQLKEKGNES